MSKFVKLTIYSLLLSCSGLVYAASPFSERSINISTSNDSEINIYEVENTIINKSSIEDEKTEEKVKEEEKNIAPIDGVITVDGSLRLREYPWGPVLGIYSNNTKCSIIGEDGEFYKVNINGSIGYLHKNYVSTASKPASGKEPVYPEGCRLGGYVAKANVSSSDKTKVTTKDTPTTKVKVTSTTNKIKDTTQTTSTPATNIKSSVIGKTMGDGTAAGAVSWAKDQMAGGTQKGCNRNSGKTSKDPTCWNYWCGAFISTAWGRTVPQMIADSAYGQYKNFKNAGMIHTDKNPPAGAIMFTGPTTSNKYGHVFLATGEVDSKGEPIIITSGWTGHNGITTMTLSQMIGSTKYLGWALPE